MVWEAHMSTMKKNWANRALNPRAVVAELTCEGLHACFLLYRPHQTGPLHRAHQPAEARSLRPPPSPPLQSHDAVCVHRHGRCGVLLQPQVHRLHECVRHRR